MIQAIETRYAGCRFRSRLEARWAVFFDTHGITWEYEPQGFVIDGRPYLPDFLLTECGTWVEVKGSDRDLDRPFLQRAALALPEAPYGSERGPRLMILGPIPRPLRTGDWGWLGMDPPSGHLIEESGSPTQPNSLHYGFGSFHKNHRPWYLANAEETDGWLAPSLDRTEGGLPESYAAARSARFEHGEQGA